MSRTEGPVKPVKLNEAVAARRSAASEKPTSQECSTFQEEVTQEGSESQLNCCGSCGKAVAKKVCTSCEAICYCDAECQKRHWKQHKTLCNAIKALSDKEKERCSYSSHLTPDEERKYVQLVGRRCTVECRIDNVNVNALWDTGTEVSLISSDWLHHNIPGKEVKSVSSLLGVNLEVEGVGRHDVPYAGYATLTVKIDETELEVPFLVTRDKLSQPIIGFNVIDALTEGASGKNCQRSMLKSGFKQLSEAELCKLEALLAEESSNELTVVKVNKVGTIIPAGTSTSVKCTVDNLNLDRRTPVIFEPHSCLDESLHLEESVMTLKKGIVNRVNLVVSNCSSKDIILAGKTNLGQLSLVQSIIPAGINLKQENSQSQEKESEKETVNLETLATEGEKKIVGSLEALEPEICEENSSLKKSIDSIQLDGLSASEQDKVRKMLWEERNAFADEDEIGCAQELVMEINTEDEVPVQKTYNSIPRHLYQAVKEHVQDLLNKGWIKNQSLRGRHQS